MSMRAGMDRANDTSGSRVRIRAAVPEDAEAIAAICVRSAEAAYADLVTPEYLARLNAHFHAVDRIRREVPPSDGWFGFVVAHDHDHVVGVAGTGRSAEHPDACELFTLYVAPACQRHGIGRALVARSLAQAADASAKRLDVAVLPGNLAAVRFYEACGFSSSGERAIYAPHGEEGGPRVALVYTRHL